LLAFLDAGAAPVYLGFGSMQGFDPRTLLRTIVQAVGERRALFNPGWSGMDGSALPANFHVVEDVPHDWLFSRVAAVVHHGGSGTSHSACRAGAPSVVMPFAGDQAFWAERLFHLGVAPRSLKAGSLNPDRLRRALDEATAEGMRERARAVGQRMGQENGLATAVALIERSARAGRRS
jgi:UDP:flavonoid glycosyltransferase YjiC (YdhE family)